MNKKSLKLVLIGFIVSALLLVLMPANAHHNYVSHYDMEAPKVEVTGTVHSFWFVNPHMRVYINVPDEATGKNVVWVAEGRSRSILAREGWVGDEIQKGDPITVIGTPARTEKMKTHMLLGGPIKVKGELVHAGALEKKVKDFQLGGDGAATAGSHLDRGARDEGEVNIKLPKDQAKLLSEFLTRFSSSEDSQGLDQAEESALRNLNAELEKVLATPVANE